jgi:hypothetical protein
MCECFDFEGKVGRERCASVLLCILREIRLRGEGIVVYIIFVIT